jgi:ABC-2 type transport system ATP-binding protein
VFVNKTIKIDHASVEIDDTSILHDISLNISSGKIVGLLGPSGAGKTTLIRAIIGRQSLSAGSITVFDHPAGHPSLRPRLGYMTQSPAIYNDLTVQENMRYFASMRGLGRHHVEDALEQVALSPQVKQLASSLSGGQKSRLSLAIALLGEPDLLVLDEPTVGVDPVLRKQLWDLFARLAAQGKTLLISSHVMDEADHCDELVLVRDGRILAQGSPDELRKQTHTHSIEASFLTLVGGAA